MSSSRLRSISLSLLALGSLTMPGYVHASGIEDAFNTLQDTVKRWVALGEDIFKLDDKTRDAIWEVMCGGDFGYNNSDEVRKATEAVQQVRREELDKFNSLAGDYKALQSDLDKFKKLPDYDNTYESKVKDLEKLIEPVNSKMNKLADGVALKGSDHPFVKESIEYGKKMHVDLCSKYADSVNVCDKAYDNMSGRRPDLVTVGHNGLWVFEFKPNGSKSMGQEQLDFYMPKVKTYYQQFFNDRINPSDQSPDPKFGGQDFKKALYNSDSAWDSSGKELIVQGDVKEYDRCAKPRSVND